MNLIAPGATRLEALVCYSSAAAGAALSTVLAARSGLSALPLAVIAVVAFDLYGGAAVNATSSAKRHFHRDGRTWRHHLGFVAIHVQPFLLALVVPGFGWWTATVIYALALVGAVVVLGVPRPVRLPVAFAVTALAIGLAQWCPPPSPGSPRSC